MTSTATLAPLREPDDVAAAARLHARALPTGLFPSLGPGFLATYLRTFVDAPDAVALVARVDGRFAGFLVGTTDNDAHYRWAARRHGTRLALRMAAALLVRPRALGTFLTTRLPRYARAALRLLGIGSTSTGTDGAGDGAPTAGPIAVLTHVAVAADQRGHGVGSVLSEAMVTAAREAGATEIHLVTTTAPDFYRSRGWTEHPRGDATDVREFRLDLTHGEAA